MNDQFLAFLECPSAENYRRVRRSVLDGPAYDANALDIAQLTSLSERGCYNKVVQLEAEMESAWCLSPRVHMLVACAYEKLGALEEYETERFLFSSCMEGLLACGKGTLESPYLVTYTSDEYAILSVLELEWISQALIEHGSRRFDVIQCNDGSERWFDVTDIVRLRQAVAGPHRKARASSAT